MPKRKCQLRPNGRSFCLISKNRVGQYGFKNSKSRRPAKLHDWFKSYNNFTTVFFSQKSKTSMWGVYPEGIDWNIALHTQISFWAGISEVGSQKHLGMGPIV